MEPTSRSDRLRHLLVSLCNTLLSLLITLEQAEILKSLDHKMVQPHSVTIDTGTEIFRGDNGYLYVGLLEGRSERMAIKEIRATGDIETRLRTQVVSLVAMHAVSPNAGAASD